MEEPRINHVETRAIRASGKAGERLPVEIPEQHVPDYHVGGNEHEGDPTQSLPEHARG